MKLLLCTASFLLFSTSSEARLRKRAKEPQNVVLPDQKYCPVSTEVTCHRVDNGEPCDYTNTSDAFKGLFHFTYCNTLPKVGEHTSAIDYFVGEVSLKDDKILLNEAVHDISLGPETCRKLGHVMHINGNMGDFQASISIEALVENKVLCQSNATYRIAKELAKKIY